MLFRVVSQPLQIRYLMIMALMGRNITFRVAAEVAELYRGQPQRVNIADGAAAERLGKIHSVDVPRWVLLRPYPKHRVVVAVPEVVHSGAAVIASALEPVHPALGVGGGHP